jgi:hypothetical protein
MKIELNPDRIHSTLLYTYTTLAAFHGRHDNMAAHDATRLIDEKHRQTLDTQSGTHWNMKTTGKTLFKKDDDELFPRFGFF